MTREEAIKILKQRECCRECVANCTCNECDKAFEMAIEALKQETCEDAVSRKEVLEMIEQIQDAGGFIGYNTYSEAFDRVDNMTLITPTRKKGHWIITNNYLTAAYETIDYVKCSCCGEESLEEGDYCPNCGSFMKGEFE